VLIDQYRSMKLDHDNLLIRCDARVRDYEVALEEGEEAMHELQEVV
jgi:hypothetical protein